MGAGPGQSAADPRRPVAEGRWYTAASCRWVAYGAAVRADLTTGQTLAFDHVGPRQGTPIVLLHGLSGNRRTYQRVAAHLSGRTEVFCVDMRGHGESTRAADVTGYRADEYATDIAAFLRDVVGRPALVAGHSLGGVVAAVLATPSGDPDGLVQAVFLEDPPLFEGDDVRRAASPVAAFFPKLVAAVQELQRADAPLGAYEELAAAMVPAQDVAERALSLRMWDPITMQAAIDGVVWRGFDPTVALSRPVTALCADPVVGAVFTPEDAAAFRSVNPNARVETVTGAGHGIHDDATLGAYLDELDGFVATYGT